VQPTVLQIGRVLLLLLVVAAVSFVGCGPRQPSQPTPQPGSTPVNDPTVQSVIQQLQQLERMLATAEPMMIATLSAGTPVAAPTATEPPTEAETTSEQAGMRVFPTRTPRPILASDAQPCQPGQVKANRSSRIYHVPGGGSYVRTTANVVCYDTEVEAEAAGYRKARN